ncbi:aspartic proteinase 36-like [Impatiens glandulifera]|uniref:aspartic proteinase 36-like n=1 Tax=Impatiens glandulifera TaxID=253017 RepID=UPI001FB118C9|nr:aspartic proteinase 36-like [Impatiens glandulifera]
MVMDLRRETRLAVVGLSLLVLELFLGSPNFVNANAVFRVQHKFGAGGGDRERRLSSFKAHDVRRHQGRVLAADIPLGGDGSPTATALYYTRIGIGSPSQSYYVQVDTGSDILWVNCAGCTKCPKTSDLGVELRLYDPTSSSTSKEVTCDQEFCSVVFGDALGECKVGSSCPYTVTYGDGSSTAGYFVKDIVQLDKPSGNLQTTILNGSVSFGCASKQSGQLGSTSEALDGIVGFGQSNSSMISQLSLAGKVKKIFAHCLDGDLGGGIFAIGEVVQPKVNSTPIIPNQQHYNVKLKGIEVDKTPIKLTHSLFGSPDRGAIVDSGTTLAYLPDEIFNPLMAQILDGKSDLKFMHVDDQFTCFTYSTDVDEGFPPVKLTFDQELTMTVYPRDYLFRVRDDTWCFGWMNSGIENKDGQEMLLLGDMVLANKLVLYDLENQTIGWTDYNCSQPIKIKDEETGGIYDVGYHILSSGDVVASGWLVMMLSFSLVAFLVHNFDYNELLV